MLCWFIMEFSNMRSLIEDLKQMREQWDAILDESKLVAGIEPVLSEHRQKRFADESLQDDNEHINCG